MYRKVKESQTLLINQQTKKLIEEGKQVVKFGFGQSPFLPPEPVIEALRQAAHRKEYSSSTGDIVLREKISKFHYDHNGLKVDPDHMLLAPGSKILLFNILMSFNKADVFIPMPSWVTYAPQAEIAGHDIIKVPTSFDEKWRVTPEALRACASQKKQRASILILNYPGNPDGLSYTEEELKALAEVARELDLLVVSDEIYGLLDHKNEHRSFVEFYPEKTITTTGLSKWCGAGGWRFGAAFLYEGIEKEFKQALIGISSETYSCAPVPVQEAAKVAYEDYAALTGYLNNQRQILKTVSHHATEKLNEANINVHAPTGGFYQFLDFTPHTDSLRERGITDANQLCSAILNEAQVALLPSNAFGFAADTLATRLAFVDFDTTQSSFDLHKEGKNVVTGIASICNWVNN